MFNIFETARQLAIAVLSPTLGTYMDTHYHFAPMDAEGCWKLFGAFFVFWCILGLSSYRLFAKSKGDEYASRVVSVIHALLSVALCFLGVLDGITLDPHWGHFQSTAPFWTQVACLCTGAYFTMDMIGILTSTYFSWLFVGHHLICGYAMVAVSVNQTFGFATALTTCLMEASNPFLHMRYLLIEEHHMAHKKKSATTPWSPLLTAISRCFYVVYFVGRILIGPFLTAALLTGDTPVWLQLIGSLLQIFSIQYFFVYFSKGWKGELWQ